jgi:hypothetical protein
MWAVPPDNKEGGHMKDAGDRLHAVVSITRFPGQAFHIEVSARENFNAFGGIMKGDLSPTRLVYWFNEILPEQLHQILFQGIQKLWGDDFANLPLDAADVAKMVQEDRQTIW